MKILSRRFIFAIIAIICVTGTTCYLKFDSDSYLKLVGMVCGLFVTAQTITDSLKK